MYYCEWLNEATIVLKEDEKEIARGEIIKSDGELHGKIISDTFEAGIMARIIIPKEAPHVRWFN